jgi:hypothetical protein
MPEDATMGLSYFWRRARVTLLSVLSGALLGLFYRALLGSKLIPSDLAPAALYLSFAFLVSVPVAIGYLTVAQYLGGKARAELRWYKWLGLPWLAVLLILAVALAVGWEGRICVLMAAPILLTFSLLGGLVARIAWDSRRSRHSTTLSVCVLPAVLLLIEGRVPVPDQIRTVHTAILIDAPPIAVWDNIKRVRAILPEELPGAWVDRVGFPRPIEATLSHEGMGGVRRASFTGGLIFTETVSAWEPERHLRFSIRANTASIPPSTLDEHVTIGGAAFDTLEGEYALEPVGGKVLLHLNSRERLSTHVNAYAGFWTDAVMRSIQNQILEVIRKRCESEARASASIMQRGASAHTPGPRH